MFILEKYIAQYICYFQIMVWVQTATQQIWKETVSKNRIYN